MNCRIKTQKNNRVVHTYSGMNNFIVKAYRVNDLLVTKIDFIIVDTWLQAVDKHMEFCKDYLLPTSTCDVPAPHECGRACSISKTTKEKTK